MSSNQQRREAIVAQAYAQGHVTVKGLASELGVSEATVRRELRSLADAGAIVLAHGGAYPPRSADYSFRAKALLNVDAKRVIGALAAELVGDATQVFLDSGTTCFEMVPHLRRKRGLSVIVNSVRVAEELDAPGVSVILLGGQYRPDRMDAVGPVATSTLDQFRGYMAFVGADGLGMDFGLTAADIDSAHLYRLAIKNAREAVLLADHSKFVAPSLYRIVEWSEISRVVTDAAPLPEWREFFDARGIEVIYPDAPAKAAARSQE
jgi:DeoR family transcriptional regulator of aga operon